VNHERIIDVDVLEAGSSGPVVMLVHSSVSGARQWRRLMEELKDRFRVRAVNLFGYGKTPAWRNDAPQSLDDQARLVEAALPADAGDFHLVGHSFGASVAIKTAARLNGRVGKLILLEPNPVHLLAQAGETEPYADAMAMRDCIKTFGALGEWQTAAKTFADYWGGAGSWDGMPADRRDAFTQALKPNFFEWDAVTEESTPLEEWARLLPRHTLVVSDPNTVMPIRAVVALLRRSCPLWTFKDVAGGHMAPLTRPDLINPIIVSFLQSAVE
jgi:pimeloyl-ACP methyl ester carboxylesterase